MYKEFFYNKFLYDLWSANTKLVILFNYISGIVENISDRRGHKRKRFNMLCPMDKHMWLPRKTCNILKVYLVIDFLTFIVCYFQNWSMCYF